MKTSKMTLFLKNYRKEIVAKREKSSPNFVFGHFWQFDLRTAGITRFLIFEKCLIYRVYSIPLVKLGRFEKVKILPWLENRLICGPKPFWPKNLGKNEEICFRCYNGYILNFGQCQKLP